MNYTHYSITRQFTFTDYSGTGLSRFSIISPWIRSTRGAYRTTSIPSPYNPPNPPMKKKIGAGAYIRCAKPEYELSHPKPGDHLFSVVTHCLRNALADTFQHWGPHVCRDERGPHFTAVCGWRGAAACLWTGARNTVHKIGYHDWCVVKLIHLVLSPPSDVTALNVCVCVGGRIGANVCTYSHRNSRKVSSSPKHVQFQTVSFCSYALIQYWP